jgi:hypothetical protein
MVVRGDRDPPCHAARIRSWGELEFLDASRDARLVGESEYA